MISNIKSDNQYYGKYRECCVIAALNGSNVNYNEDYSFTDEEKEQMMEEGKKIASYIGNHTAKYTGNHTSSTAGDIELDNGESIEIKCVSTGNGTYLNTSIYYFLKYGLDFKKYMDSYGLYDAIDSGSWNIKANRKNKSPISQPNSSKIRHNYEEEYNEKVIPVDNEMRKKFTEDVAHYFANNPDKIYDFIADMIEKDTETCSKGAPDRLIVFNYKTGKIKEVNLKNILNNISSNVKTNDYSLTIGNVRVAFSWQNGAGLNNPTIRVFLEV